MEEKKPFMPPPPKNLKVQPKPANEETAKPQAEVPAANSPVEQAKVVSTKEVQKPAAVVQPQPKVEEKKEEKPKTEKKNLLAPMAFIFWGAVAVVLIVLFIILKDKI